MITIDGATIPTPSKYSCGVMDINKADRSSTGNMLIERIATKRKLELTWNYLTEADLSALMLKVADVFFTVTYPDIQTGATKSGTFYTGDRTAQGIDYKNGVMRYKDIKMNLIEQ